MKLHKNEVMCLGFAFIVGALGAYMTYLSYMKYGPFHDLGSLIGAIMGPGALLMGLLLVWMWKTGEIVT